MKKNHHQVFSVAIVVLIIFGWESSGILAQNIYTLAGYIPNSGSIQGQEMGGGDATATSVASPSGVGLDGAGNIFVLEGTGGYNRVRKIYSATGKIQTVAGMYGSSCCSSSGNGGLATSATVNLNNTNIAVGVCVDASGNYYIADQGGHQIRKVDVSTGIITGVAGTSNTSGSTGDGGLATSATLNRPTGVAVDAAGNIYIADRANNKIRKVTAATGIISTIAGTGTAGFSGDGGAATAAQLNKPTSVAVDGSGNIYFVDFTNNRIRKINSGGTISTVAGTGAVGYTGDAGLATAATTNIASVAASSGSVAVDASGNFYFTDCGNHAVRKVTVSTGNISTVAGTGVTGFSGDGAAATSAQLATPRGIAVDASSNLYIADRGNHRIRKVTVSTGFISTIAGKGTTDAFVTSSCSGLAHIWFIKDVALDNSGNAYVCANAGLSNGAIWKISPSGNMTAIAGNGNPGYTGDGGLALNAQVSAAGLSLDASNNIYFIQNDNDGLGGTLWGRGDAIRKIDAATGIITTIAGGTGTVGFAGDGGLATAAVLDVNDAGIIAGIALDGAGNIYFSDNGNVRIRKITVATGIISTVAGNGVSGYNGEGVATTRNLNDPRGIEVDNAGTIYIADFNNSRVRKVTTGGVISTVAGNGTFADAGDGGLATAANLKFPTDVTVNRTNGDFYISDQNAARVRKVTAATGIISAVAGTGVPGFSGDSGPATSAQLNSPAGITRDATSGCIFIADWSNSKLRVVDVSGTCFATAGNCVGMAFLPVELLSFSGKCREKSAIIQWSTASEMNNDYFSIERSSDGKIWSEVGVVNGIGNSTTIRNYEFADESPLNLYTGEDGKVFYRLRQTDFDGKYEYFGPISVACLSGNDWSMVIQSLISGEAVGGTFSSPEDAALLMNVFDARGKVIAGGTILALEGSNYFRVEFGNIPSGIYFITLQNSDVNLHQKFIKN